MRSIGTSFSSLLIQCGDGPLEILTWQAEPVVSGNGSGVTESDMVAVLNPS